MKQKNLLEILQQFKIRECSVKLDRAIFSQINITCSEFKLKCEMEQQNHNTFSIKIKRKMIDDIGENDRANPKKKVKFGGVQVILTEQSIGNTFVCIIFSIQIAF